MPGPRSIGGRRGRGSQAGSGNWLRPATARSPRSRTLWRPPSLPANADPKGLSYLVVEEQVGLILAVLVAPWPVVDRQGRLWFALDDVVEVTAEAPDLQAALSKRRVPRGLNAEQADALRHRPVALGDVFAARVDPRRAAKAAASPEPPPVGAWLKGQVFDLTADAREVAREAFLQAVTPPLPARVERSIRANLVPPEDRA